ncbi:sulfite oxidase heme-binding subunit YedZ [Pseudogemmobacter sonorensis]|uniref:sulfite oxidase heme-binding subunit YedZ n=1 Tax=Pseudogemmobacter sonorensis TaxID=2989681 RepID=UPI003696818D
MNQLLRALPGWSVWLLGLMPLAWLVWLVFFGGLGVDPVKEIEHRLGKIGLWFLVGGLAISPLRRLGVNALRHRRAIGLLAFLYVALHFLAWLILDMGMLWGQAGRDLLRRPYLFLGILGLALMLPLALTSNDASIRRLGRAWRRLHWLTYPAVLLGVAHYLWQMRIVSTEGWLWLAAVLGLILLRFRPR